MGFNGNVGNQPGILEQKVTFLKFADDGAAATNSTTYVFRAPPNTLYEIVDVQLVANAALTANDTNYATVSVKNPDASTTPASLNTKTSASGGTGNWAAGSAFPMTLDTTRANRLVQAGQRLDVDILKTGTGVVVPGAAGGTYV